MEMDILSPKNLHDLLADAGGKFSPATTAMLGNHMLTRIKLVHSKLYIRRWLYFKYPLYSFTYCILESQGERPY